MYPLVHNQLHTLENLTPSYPERGSTPIIMLNRLNLLLYLGGLGIILLGFILFLGDLPMELFLLDLAVVAFAYSILLFIGRSALLGLTSDHDLAGLGMQLSARSLYALAAVVLVILGIIWPEFIGLRLQLILQVSFAFLLCLCLLLSAHTSEQVQEVAQRESSLLQARADFRRSFQPIAEAIALGRINDGEILTGLNQLQEQLSYLVPMQTIESETLARRFNATCWDLQSLLSSASTMDREVALDKLRELHYIVAQYRTLRTN